MKRIIHQSMAFACACAATALICNRLVPESVAEQPKEKTNISKPRPPEIVDVAALVHGLEESANNETRLKAALRFNEIPVSQVRGALERITLIDGGKLTFPAKLLLMRWAGENGNEAADWAWKRFRSEGVWNEAFKEIVASWAWHRPKELYEWARRHAEERKPTLDEIGLVEAGMSDHPLLNFDSFDRIRGTLVLTSPREAYSILQIRGGYSSSDVHMDDALSTVEAVRESLLAFDHLDQLRPDRSEGSQIYAMSLMHRWKELDPEDFSRSPYAHLVPDRSSWKTSPIPDGPKGWQREFEEWNGGHRGMAPETTSWSLEKQEAWKDYQILQSFRRNDRS